MKIDHNISLKPYNTFGIDVRAGKMVIPENEKDIINYLEQHSLKKRQTFILGGGSNVLFTRDFDGTVFKMGIKGITVVHEDDNHVYIRAGAGESWEDLVDHTVEKGYGGLENLSMIPGSVGAAPIQNIGAYGVEQGEHFHQLEAVSIREQEKRTFNAGQCRFGYRYSIFKDDLQNQYVITAVTYRLDKQPVLKLDYGQVRQELEAMGIDNPAVQHVAQAIKAIRTRKLPHPDQTGNAGSFFKNPVVTMETWEKLKARYPDMPGFQAPHDHMKIAAAWLIQHCGWKGKAVGHAMVHKNHALVLVNLGKATGAEVLHLSRMIRMSVEKQFAIKLEYEVNIL